MHTEKSIGAVLAETTAELKDFFDTRVQLLHSELREKARALKQSAPWLLIAAALLFAAWITLTFALVALIQTWFQPSAYSWMWAAVIVACIYLAAGIAIGWSGYTEIRTVGVAPKRTLEVLKQDQVWIQNEARTV
ncbi:MAG TPA: phage holin family protein [Candidatus Angelobacter sp.]|nr:phage holin family protein [Candidatus Angelobacter sp.]